MTDFFDETAQSAALRALRAAEQDPPDDPPFSLFGRLTKSLEEAGQVNVLRQRVKAALGSAPAPTALGRYAARTEGPLGTVAEMADELHRGTVAGVQAIEPSVELGLAGLARSAGTAIGSDAVTGFADRRSAVAKERIGQAFEKSPVGGAVGSMVGTILPYLAPVPGAGAGKVLNNLLSGAALDMANREEMGSGAIDMLGEVSPKARELAESRYGNLGEAAVGSVLPALMLGGQGVRRAATGLDRAESGTGAAAMLSGLAGASAGGLAGATLTPEQPLVGGIAGAAAVGLGGAGLGVAAERFGQRRPVAPRAPEIPVPGVRFAEASAEDFDAALKRFAAAKPDKQGFITWRSPDEMRAEGMRTFLSEDGNVGYAIAPDGDIRNVFNAGGPKGAGAYAVTHAIEQGGSKLDAFDTDLTKIYRDLGFVSDESKRLQWDDQYAPANWDYEQFGRPDVVFMDYKGPTGTADELYRGYAGVKATRDAARGRRGALGSVKTNPVVSRELLGPDLTEEAAGGTRVYQKPGALVLRGKPTPETFRQAVDRVKGTARGMLGDPAEARAHMEDGNPESGWHWYKKSIAAMDEELQSKLPELKDPAKMTLFKFILAATSPENNPLNNMQQAIDIWRHWRGRGDLGPLLETERGVPVYRNLRATKPGVAGSKGASGFGDQVMGQLGQLLDDYRVYADGDMDAAIKMLAEDLQAPVEKGVLPGGRGKNNVYDLLGRKTGSFFLNMLGNPNPVTVDVWAVRTGRRALGYGVESFFPQKEINGALTKATDEIVGADGKPVPGEWKLDGAPSDVEYDVVEQAFKELAEEYSAAAGTKIDPMDVQGRLWYLEKRLWEQSGAKASGTDDFLKGAQVAEFTQVHEDVVPGTGERIPNMEWPPVTKAKPTQGIRDRLIRAADDDEVLARVNADRNAALRGGQPIADPNAGRKLLRNSERGALGGRGTRDYETTWVGNPSNPTYRQGEDAAGRAIPMTPGQAASLEEGITAAAPESRGVPKTVERWDEVRARAASVQLEALPDDVAQWTDRRAMTQAVRQNVARLTGELADMKARMGEVDGEARALLEADYKARFDARHRQLVQLGRSGTESGRDLNALKMAAYLDGDPGVWLLKAERDLGRRLTPEEAEDITTLANKVSSEQDAKLAEQYNRAKATGDAEGQRKLGEAIAERIRAQEPAGATIDAPWADEPNPLRTTRQRGAGAAPEAPEDLGIERTAEEGMPEVGRAEEPALKGTRRFTLQQELDRLERDRQKLLESFQRSDPARVNLDRQPKSPPEDLGIERFGEEGMPTEGQASDALVEGGTPQITPLRELAKLEQEIARRQRELYQLDPNLYRERAPKDLGTDGVEVRPDPFPLPEGGQAPEATAGIAGAALDMAPMVPRRGLAEEFTDLQLPDEAQGLASQRKPALNETSRENARRVRLGNEQIDRWVAEKVGAKVAKARLVQPTRGERIAELASELRGKGAVEELLRYIGSRQTTGPLEQVVSVWRSGLLTKPASRILDFVGGMLHYPLEVINAPARVAADLGLEKRFRGLAQQLGLPDANARTATMPSLEEVRSWWAALPEGAKETARTLKLGVLAREGLPAWTKAIREADITEEMIRRFDAGQKLNITLASLAARKVGVNPGVLAKSVDGALDFYTHLGFRLAASTDRMPRLVAMGAALADVAEARALREGFTGQGVIKRAEEILADPSAADLLDAKLIADQITFTNESWLARASTGVKTGAGALAREFGGEVGEDVARATVGAIVPFARTGANIVDKLWDYSAVGALFRNRLLSSKLDDQLKAAVDAHYAGDQAAATAAYQEGLRLKRRIAESTGRAGTGVALMTLGAYLYKHGLAQPSYPRDDREARERADIANLSYGAVRRGDDEWAPITRFAPFGAVIMMGVDAAAAFDASESVAGTVVGAPFAAARAGLQLPLAQGLSQFSETLNSRDGSAVERFVGGYARSAVPFAGLTGALARGGSDIRRKPDNLLDYWQQSVPGLQDRVPARISQLGDSLPQLGGGGVMGALRAATDPLYGTQELPGPVPQAINETRTNVPTLKREEGESLESYNQRLITRGKVLRPELQQVVESDLYQRMPQLFLEHRSHYLAQFPELDDVADDAERIRILRRMMLEEAAGEVQREYRRAPR